MNKIKSIQLMWATSELHQELHKIQKTSELQQSYYISSIRHQCFFHSSQQDKSFIGMYDC